jgi:hypothetical protein
MNHRFFLITIAVVGLIVLPNFFGYPPASASRKTQEKIHLTEAFEPWLSKRITTMDELMNYIDVNYKGEKNTPEFLNYISTVISSLFYHGYSYYSLSDNWVAALFGKLFWKDLSAIVIPDDILKHPNAACSQQSIVLMECVKRYGMDYRQIFFDHHFAVEVRVGNKWHYIDVNKEVSIPNKSLEDLLEEGSLFSLYKNKLPLLQVKQILGKPRYGTVNSSNAPRAELFQLITGRVSQNLFSLLFCLELWLLCWYYLRLNSLSLKTN